MKYNKQQIIDRYKKGEKLEFELFYGHWENKDGKITNTCLSQWFMRDFEVDGVVYSCAEQYMMASKARLFGCEEVLGMIMSSLHPNDMKGWGRRVRPFDPEVWEDNCRDIVLKGNLAKFSQNKDLLEYLLGTGDKIIVEASPYDAIWGIGMGKQDPRAKNPMQWNGSNYLGFVLMEVRDRLRG